MCIRQADCILIVGLAGKDPKVQEVCVLFYHLKIRQRRVCGDLNICKRVCTVEFVHGNKTQVSR